MQALQSKIDEIIVKHNAIIEQYPDISNINWDIHGVSYKDFKEWRENHNSSEEGNPEHRFVREDTNNDNLWMFLNPWHIGVPRITIHIATVPLKFKTTIQVFEYQ